MFPAFALLTAVAVLAVLWPVFRRQRPVERDRYEVEVYRDQLAEVDRDLERGLVSSDEARAARLEIERRLLRVASSMEAKVPAEPGPGRRGIVLAVALLVPTLAATFYAVLGSPDLPDRPLAMRQDLKQENPERPDVQQMVARLEARLARSPDDLQGWLMLGRSRAVLGDTSGSVEAFRRAQGLAADDPGAVGGLAEALTAAAGGTVTPEARTLFVKLTEVEPRDPRAGFYLGWAEFQAGEHRAALDRWLKLLGESPADAPWRPQVAEAIQAAAKELKLDPATVLAQVPTPPATATSPAVPQPSAEDVAGAAAMAPDDRMAMIRGMVEKLQARMDADGTDVQGWLRLAQSRSVLGETDRARATFQKALSLHPDEPTLLKGYAEALVGPVRTDTGLPEVGDQANELLTKAAGLQPEDPEVWWYLGIRALQDGRKDQARSAWQKVLAGLDPAQPEYQDIKNRIDSLGS
jgi:cytochrome c-type biogenesis protein CcmH